MSTPRAAAAFLSIALLTAGCGVGAQSHPVSAGVEFVSDEPTPLPSPSTSRSVKVTVYLVKDQSLVAVVRALPAPISITSVLDSLAAEPSPAEQRVGLRSALTAGLDIASVIVTARGEAVIRLSAELSGPGAAELVLAFGQIVLSVTQLPEIRSASFTAGDEKLLVPRGDGSLTASPVTANDYSQLLARTSSPSADPTSGAD